MKSQVKIVIKDNQKLFNRLHVLIDALIIIFSYGAAWFIRFKSGLFALSSWYLSLSQYMKVLVFVVPIYLILYYAFQLYTPKRGQGRRIEAWHIVQANIIGLLVFILILYLAKMTDYSRKMLFVFFCVNVVAEIGFRNVLRWILRKYRKQGYNQKHILLVGYSRAAEGYLDRVVTHPEWGYIVKGILADNKPEGEEYRGIKILGGTDKLAEILPQNQLDEIVITLGLAEYHKLGRIVNMCEKSGVHTKFVPDYNNIIPTKPYTEDILGLPVINIRYVPLSNTFNSMIKRVMDIIGSIIGIIVASPVMLVMCILIKITSPGPLIYRQERVGLHNQTFWMYKFRSMEIQPEAEEKKAWTVKNDPRVTGIGRFMRRTSIDELPQLFNILKGDMSLVGPRPERPFFVEKFREEIPRYMVKHQVRPGLTGWAQVNGYRGDTSIRKRIEYDLYYIENWTVGLDIKILFMTIFKGFINKNAY